jgi:hypothetical protein
MAKSAQQKFNEYLDECRETQQSVNAFTDASHKLHGDYAYAAGYFGSLVADLVSQLPKAKRAEYRAQLFRQAEKFEKERLLKTIKETA